MHRLLFSTVIGAALAASAARAGEPAKDADCGCGKFGTTVAFVDTPSEAAKQALKEGKLVFVLHVSGDFENSGLT